MSEYRFMVNMVKVDGVAVWTICGLIFEFTFVGNNWIVR